MFPGYVPGLRDGTGGGTYLDGSFGTGSLDNGRSHGQQSEQRRQRPQRCDWHVSLVHHAQIRVDGSAQIVHAKRVEMVTSDPSELPLAGLAFWVWPAAAVSR